MSSSYSFVLMRLSGLRFRSKVGITILALPGIEPGPMGWKTEKKLYKYTMKKLSLQTARILIEILQCYFDMERDPCYRRPVKTWFQIAIGYTAYYLFNDE